MNYQRFQRIARSHLRLQTAPNCPLGRTFDGRFATAARRPDTKMTLVTLLVPTRP